MRWRRRSPSWGGGSRHCIDPTTAPRLDKFDAVHSHGRGLQQVTRNLRRTLDESIIEAQRKRLAFPRRTPVTQQPAQPMVVTGTRDVNGTAHRPGTNQFTSRE